ncbi:MULTISPECIES: hypothetical protein [Kitasatospora]|uniref:Uncharacterized protein n=1 Tax=Kitasatospora setae (strain ATCC 33774 / DSM 43861 / JCM 3304 / KCC A-0304 / NBRC 14216 / KM-6054) TaxID=452652 RepID=E4NCY5_KITSK|nr:MULTISPECIES: hypothetical protein [Kitasatospora]BAJ29066.1 hypothetical protein KSE_32570 [Kitasatospora setae KM-6054]
MARGTAHQVELLRAEVGTTLRSGLMEIRDSTDNLRSELTATLAAGLSEHRDELFETIAKHQQEASRANHENRSLHRQISAAKEEVRELQLAARASAAVEPSGPASAAEPTATAFTTDATEPAAPADHEETTVSEPIPADEPTPGALPSDQLRQIVAEVTASLSTQRPTEQAPEEQAPPTPEQAAESAGAPELSSEQLRVLASEVAAQLADLLRTEPGAALTAEEVPATGAADRAAEEPEAVAPLPPAGTGGDVSALIPASLAWEQHVATLLKAAGVKTVLLSCHPETWDFLASRVAENEHFSKPAEHSEEGIVLSGRSTIALLHELRETVHGGLTTDNGIETWALAVTGYERIAAVVNATQPVGAEDSGRQPRIILDDRDPRDDHDNPDD